LVLLRNPWNRLLPRSSQLVRGGPGCLAGRWSTIGAGSGDDETTTSRRGAREGREQEQEATTDNGSTTIEELAEIIGKYDSITLRAALHRFGADATGGRGSDEAADAGTASDAGDAWSLVHAEVTTGDEPGPAKREVAADADAVSRRWRYPRHAFVEQPLAGRVAAALITSREPQTVAGLRVIAPATQPTATFQRLPSHRQWGPALTSTRWPRTEWELCYANTTSTLGEQLLVGDGPAFISYEAAFAAFFYAVGPSNLAGQQPLWRIRRVDRRAWLQRVAIAPAALTVSVEGSKAAGAEVQLTTPTSMVTHRVGPTGEVRFPLPDGLANGTLLALTGDGDWLDYRYFAYPGRGDQQDESVVWDEPDADLQVPLSGGEGPTVEFKRELPADDRESKRTVLKTIAAFATGAGGTVLFGVDDVTAEPVGLDTATMPVERQRDRLTNMIRDCIDPEPGYDLQVADLDGKTLLVLHVHAGGRGAYALFPERPEFYVRRGASTFRARQQDIAAAFRQPDRGAVASSYWAPGWSGRFG